MDTASGTTHTPVSTDVVPDEWRGYDEVLDSREAGAWDHEHADSCVYWPDCQVNGDHPNPLIYGQQDQGNLPGCTRQVRTLQDTWKTCGGGDPRCPECATNPPAKEATDG